MGLFDMFFGNKAVEKTGPNIRFGRFSEIYKTPVQLEDWKKGYNAFENEKFIDAYKHFLAYLNDQNQDNVHLEEKEDGIHFNLVQGSKKIYGTANSERVKAHVKVVHCERLNVGFMRRLIDQNFSLKHSRFALDDDNNVVMRFDSFAIDGSPFKLYAGLKEMALKADKLDDLLIDEFEMLKAIDSDHTSPLPKAEVDAKFAYLQSAFKQTMDRIATLHPTKDAIPVSILLRYLFYRLDYLIQPEGFLMSAFEECHNIMFARDQKSVEKKNNEIIKKLAEAIARSREDFDKEMYKVPATFGITAPVNHEWVVGTIDTELTNIDWFRTNNFEDISIATGGYLATYSLFNFAVPQPDREYFHLLVEILETAYFKSLGIDHGYFNTEKGTFDRSAIRQEVRNIAKANRGKFPKLDPDTGLLKYKSLSLFVKSFILMIKGLDLTPAEK